MIDGKRIAVVMPAYNAEKTLEKTVRGLPGIVDIKILVDDSSNDNTARLSEELGVQTFIHDKNYGYGRNQQTCYREALKAGADIVVMVHPDYQTHPLSSLRWQVWSPAVCMMSSSARGSSAEGHSK